MEPEDIDQNEQDNPNDAPQANGNTADSPSTPKYRVLGESGLVEDEEGNIYSASEIDEYLQPRESADSSQTSAFRHFGVSSVLDDKANPAYWYHHYDERYCGPSREAYMEKMAKQYRESVEREPEKQTAHPERREESPSLHKRTTPLASTAPEATTQKVSAQQKSPSSVDARDERHRNKPLSSPESSNEPFFIVPEAIREKAKRDQQEVIRCGIRPTYRQARITVIYGLNFVAVIDRNNQVIVSNEKYRDVDFYYNGRARALDRKTWKYGFLDRHGNEVIPCVWRSAGQFSEYLVAVQNDERKVGYVDVTGRLVIPCTWREGWCFNEGLARVQDDNNKIGMIDQRGKLVIPCVWRGMGDFSEGLASFMDDDGKCGYMDRTGKIVIPSRWKNAWTFCEGRAVVQDFDKRLGYIDKSGELVIPCHWKKVNYFRNGMAKVSDSKSFFFKDKWVWIDKQGRIVDP